MSKTLADESAYSKIILKLDDYKDYNMPFVSNFSLSYNFTSSVSSQQLQIRNEMFWLLPDVNSYLTILFVDQDIERTHYIKVAQFDDPLGGIFSVVTIKFTDIQSNNTLSVDVTCFLAKDFNNYTVLGYNGYLGLAPFNEQQEAYSFTRQVRKTILGDANRLGFTYFVKKDHPLGNYYGFFNIQSITDTNMTDDLPKDYIFQKGINIPSNSTLIDTPDYSNPFHNNLTVNIGPFMDYVRIENFHVFPKGDIKINKQNYSTYINVSDVGIKMSKDYYNFLNYSFLQYLCQYKGERLLKSCSCRGNNFQGMPSVTFESEGYDFQLSPPDYLLFPTIDNVQIIIALEPYQETRQTRCSNSIYYERWYNFSIEDATYPVQKADYVLGETFLATFNPLFIIDFNSNGTTTLTVLMLKGRDKEIDYSSIIVAPIVGVIFLALVTFLTKKKQQRQTAQYQRWKVIKELEEDYDVYVSDEYAYHINELKVQMEQLNNFGMDKRISDTHMASSAYTKRQLMDVKRLSGSSSWRELNQLDFNNSKDEYSVKRRTVSHSLDLTRKSHQSLEYE